MLDALLVALIALLQESSFEQLKEERATLRPSLKMANDRAACFVMKINERHYKHTVPKCMR